MRKLCLVFFLNSCIDRPTNIYINANTICSMVKTLKIKIRIQKIFIQNEEYEKINNKLSISNNVDSYNVYLNCNRQDIVQTRWGKC